MQLSRIRAWHQFSPHVSIPIPCYWWHCSRTPLRIKVIARYWLGHSVWHNASKTLGYRQTVCDIEPEDNVQVVAETRSTSWWISMLKYNYLTRCTTDFCCGLHPYFFTIAYINNSDRRTYSRSRWSGSILWTDTESNKIYLVRRSSSSHGRKKWQRKKGFWNFVKQIILW